MTTAWAAAGYHNMKVKRPTMERARALKVHPRETDDDLINRLVDLAERERREEAGPDGRRAS